MPAVPSASLQTTTIPVNGYGGSATCRRCHEAVFQRWTSSHHALAERAAEGDGVAVDAVGLDGKRSPFRAERVVGVDPLREYIVAGANGRDQVLQTAFDPAKDDWFSVFGNEDRQPGEWGHWTGRGMSWNAMCAYCHNTHLTKGYDAKTDGYHTTMSEPGVGCEACHGPMKAHADRADRDPTVAKMSPQQRRDTCGSCHARRAELTSRFMPGDRFDDHFELEIPDLGDQFYADGQVRDEDYELTSFLGSRMHRAGVTCQDCHDPHSSKLLLPGNALCLRCHDGNKPNVPKIEVEHHTFHKIDGPGSACVSCHMPLTTYMQRHPRRDHGFTIPDPDLTIAYAIPNACTRCHGDRPPQWAARSVARWFGDKMERRTRSRARAIARARAGDRSALPDVVAILEKDDIGLWRAVGARVGETFLPDRAMVEALVHAIGDPDPLVRDAAIRSLEPVVASADPTVVSSIQKALADPVRAVRVAAAWVLRARMDEKSTAGVDLARYLEQVADQPTGQLQNGAFELARGRTAAALTHFEKAVLWDPRSAPLRHELAVAYSVAGRSKDAVLALEEACRLAPKDADYRFRLGLGYSEAGDLPSAISSFAKATELDSHHARAWYNLGLARDQAGESAKGLDALDKAERSNPSDADIPYASAVILSKLGRKADAKHAAARALALRPDFSAAEALMQTQMP